MKRIVAGLLGILLCAGGAGCQPTPEADIVVYKGQSASGMIPNEPGNHYQAPAHVAEEVNLYGLRVEVDAPVQVPNLPGYGVTEVKKQAFSADYLSFLVHYFVPDAQLYAEAVLDKRQIAERLLALEQVEVQEGQNKAFILEAYRGALKTAPEPMDVQALRQPFSIADAPEGESCWAFSPNDRYDTYYWFSMERGGNHFLYYRDHSANIICESHLDETSPQQKDFEGAFPISYEGGVAVAQQTVDALGLRDMGCSFGEKACVYQDGFILKSKGWQYVFTKESQGLLSYYIGGGGIWNNQTPKFASPWGEECLLITVDRDGVLGFDWRRATIQTAVLEDDVALLPFEQILERAQQQLAFRHAPKEDTADEKYVHVYEIRLASVMVNVPNETEVAQFIPAWDFLYELRSIENGAEYGIPYVLCLDATDGSYIEPRVMIDPSVMPAAS